MADSLWRFQILLESAAEPGLVPVSVPASASPGEVAEALEAMFAAEPELARVNLEVGDQVLGTTGRAVLARLRERSQQAARGDPGTGDGATLPGLSTAYVVLRFRCRSCAAERRLLFVDDTPTCPNGHGAMERVR